MPSQIVPATDPVVDELSGNDPRQVARRLLHAARPGFFPASALPVLAGTAWGYAVAGEFELPVFLLAMLATICVHAAANVLNDVGDDSVGTDRVNEDRIYPYTGGSRFIQTGIMTASAMARLGISLLAVAAIAGTFLLLAKGPMVLVFGLCGVALGVLYSLGPLRLSGLGIGEFAVAIAFGVMPVTGAAWLQSGTIDVGSLLFSLPISAWGAAILLINEVPDIVPDGRTGKRTLPVRLGLGRTRILYLALHLAAFAVVVSMTAAGLLPLAAPALPAVLLYPACKASMAIPRGLQDRKAMQRGIESTLAIHTLGSLWLCGCVIVAAWWPA